ncbi:asparagine synthase-related protein, partial [Desulfocurvus sp.]|uniref:asparagine synthase-related protein n=1 Tax=Desulfocurvus sp. TaxID=2871698 RepID=UPI0025C3799D
DFGSPVRGRMYADLFQMKIPKLLMFQDKMAMASAVEVRVPFLDHVLFERLFAVPEELLLREGYTKHLLRQVAARFDDPIARSYQEPVKRYMPTPQREWLKYELTDWVRAMIADSLLHDRGYIDKTRLAGEYEAWVGDVDLGNSYFIWKFMNLELLFREFGL